MYNTFVSPVKIVSGEGAIKEIPSLLQSHNVMRVMVFADKGVIDAGIVAILENQLKQTEVMYEVYSDLVAEPPIAVGEKALEALKSYQADLVIGIGGGSTLDIAKAVSVLCDNEGTVEEYLDLTGTKKLKSKGLPKILIPTTSGTGAEVTDIAVFSLENTKDVIAHEYLLADVAIIDPQLTYTLPSHLTAATGVDALTHAIESYISVNASPMTDAIALEAIRLITSSIRTAVWNGQDKEARSKMAIGSVMAGQSFYNAGVAGVHALAYPLGGLFKIPHGQANAVLLPYVFDYIWPSCVDKMNVVAETMGINTSSLSKRAASIEVIKELRNIIKDVGIPLTLDEFGVKEEDINILVENGISQTRLLARSPRPFAIDNVRDCYTAAYFGNLRLGQ